jgi:hypothetical protein
VARNASRLLPALRAAAAFHALVVRAREGWELRGKTGTVPLIEACIAIR